MYVKTRLRQQWSYEVDVGLPVVFSEYLKDEFEIISNVNDDLKHDEITLYTAVHHENELRSASQTNQGDFVLIKQSGR